MLFINTRPTDRAQHLTNELTKKHIRVLNLPLLELSALPFNDELKQQFLQLPDVSVIVVVSPTAAEIGIQYLKQCGLSLNDLPKVQWIAVGEKTADILRNVGLKPNVPTVETSEGMLELPMLKQLNIQRVAFWRGIGGRQFMMEYLASQGIEIVNILLYKRSLPLSTPSIFFENYESLQAHSSHIYVCISSEASWLNWKNLCKNYPIFIKKCYYLSLGSRLSDILRDQVGSERVCQMENLHAEKIRQIMIKG